MISKKKLFEEDTYEFVRLGRLEDEYVAVLLKLPYKLWFIHDVTTQTWAAGIEEFPGCLTEAGNLLSAYSNLMEAADGWVRSCLELKHPIPKPRIEGWDS